MADGAGSLTTAGTMTSLPSAAAAAWAVSMTPNCTAAPLSKSRRLACTGGAGWSDGRGQLPGGAAAGQLRTCVLATLLGHLPNEWSWNLPMAHEEVPHEGGVVCMTCNTLLPAHLRHELTRTLRL